MKAETPDRKDIRALAGLLQGIRIAMLTTQTADGRLVSRPLYTLERAFDGELWFFTDSESGKVEELIDQPDVNLAYADPERETYVSISGNAEVLHDRAQTEALWSEEAARYFPRGKDDPRLALLRVRVDTAEYWRGADRFARRLLEVAQAITGKRVAPVGERRRVDVGRRDH